MRAATMNIIFEDIFKDFINLSFKNSVDDWATLRKYNPKILKELKIGKCDTEVMNKLLLKYKGEKLEKAGFVKDGKFNFCNRIIIPYNETYFAARSFDKNSQLKNLFLKGAKKQLYYILGNDEVCYIYEGETSLIAGKHIFPDACHVSIGGVNSYKLLTNLKEYYKGKKVIFVFDNDEAGREYFEKAKQLLKGKFILSKLIFDNKYNDIDDLHYEQQEKSIDYLKEETIETYSGILEDADRYKEKTEESLIPTAEGNRNNTGFKLARSFFYKEGYDFNKVLVELIDWNSKNNPPLNDEELKSIVKSAENYSKSGGSFLRYNDNGKLVGIYAYKAAKILMDEYNFKTIGDEKKEIIHYHNGRYIKNGEKVIESWLQRKANFIIKKQDINEVIGHIQRETYKERREMDNEDTNLINFKNGILDLSKIQFDKDDEIIKDSIVLLSHSPAYLFTQQIPHKFNPQATCKKINNFFSDILSEKDIITIIEFAGFSLYRKYFLKKALILVGERDTGKTTLLKLLVAMIGLENTSGVSLHQLLKDKFASANLQYKLMNFYDDLSYEDINDTGIFKIATGSGYFTGEVKFKEQFSFLNYAKLIYATNKISYVKDTEDDAYYSRWMLAFFNNTFDSKNLNTNRKLIDELTTEEEIEGLLVLSIKALSNLLKNHKFTYELEVEETKALMERSSNPLAVFCQDYLKREKSNCWIAKDDLYLIYSLWINQYGGARITKEKFCKDLPKLVNYIIEGQKEVSKKKGVRGWLNIGLNNIQIETPKETEVNLNTPLTPFIQLTSIINLLHYEANNDAYFLARVICKKGVKGVLNPANTSLTPFIEKEKLQWDIKSLVHHACQFLKLDGELCQKSPCNWFDNKCYCEEHFMEVQKNDLPCLS